MNYSFDFSGVIAFWPELLRGMWLTIQFSVAGMVFALIIGLLAVLGRQSRLAPLRWLVIAFVELIRNTPFLVQIFFLFFGLPALGLRLTPNAGALLALSLNGGAYAAEIIRGGVKSINRGQIEAGFALGLRRLQIFRCIVIRPALRAVFPALSGQFLLLMLTSSIVSAISAKELTSVGQQIEAETFRSFEVYAVITALYFVMSLCLASIFRVIDRVYFSYPIR
jgi:polar amino acid transport system permease protein